MMYKNLSYVTLSFFYVNLIGYFFHFYVSRKLGPVFYGEFMVLYSVYLTVANVSVIIGNVAIKEIVENFERKYEILRFLRIFSLSVGVILSLLLIINYKLLARFLNLQDVRSVFLIPIGTLILFPTSLEKGFLQSTKQFGFFSLLNSFELTIRLVLAVLFLYYGLAVFGALLSSILSVLISLFILVYKNGHLKGKISKIPLKNLLYLILYTSPGGFIIYLDSVFIKKTLDPTIAGLYASFSVLGKAVLLLCLTLNSVFFPEFVFLKKDFRKMVKVVRKSNLLVSLIFVLSILGVLLFGKAIFALVFGKQYVSAFKYLPYYLGALLPLTLNVYFMSIFTALEKYLFLLYANFLSYLLGFLFLPLKTINQYLLYVGIINLIFYLLYLFLFIKLSQERINKRPTFS